MHVRITIDVTYDDASLANKNNKALLPALELQVQDAISRGLLTPTLDEIVDRYSVTAEDVTHPDDKQKE